MLEQRRLQWFVGLTLIAATACTREEPGRGERTADPAGGSSQVARGATEGERVDALLAQGAFAEVVDLLWPRYELQPAPPEMAARLARALWALEEFPKAIRLCRASLEAHPRSAEVAFLLGEMYFSLGQYPQAAESYRSAREFGASEQRVSLSLGVCLGRMRDFAAARAEFERAAAAGAPANEVDYNMAVLRIQEGDVQGAGTLLRKVLESDPQNLDAQRELARVLVDDAEHDAAHLEEGMRLLNAVLDARPEDWRANELLGDAYMASGDFEAAVTFYTEALRHGRNPQHVEDKFLRAARARNEVLRQQGLMPEAPRQRGGGPPIPEGTRTRWEREREEQGASEPDSGGSEKPLSDGSQGS